MSIKIALAGNPNCGKTTLFNAFTGSNQYVGNWPGVTVEKKEGKVKQYKDVTLVDLPGIYSLSPYTLEEVVARNYLIEEQPDAILNLIDASNLERNLYLTTQLTELGIPVLVVLNMMDVVQKNGDRIDTKRLSEELGCEVLEASALKGTGLDTVTARVVALAKSGRKTKPKHTFCTEVETALEQLNKLLPPDIGTSVRRWYAVKLFERDDQVTKTVPLTKKMDEIIQTAEQHLDDDAESIITNDRYAYISDRMAHCVKKGRTGLSLSDKIDRIVTNRFLALPIFAAVMFFVYYISVTTVGAIVTDFTNDTLFGSWISEPLGAWLPTVGVADWLSSLLVDGIIGGVGAVLGFVPQMLVLFLMLAFLEECGYMSRVAFIMDRVFRKFGLSGKSFIPMLIGTGCGIPGIMASRTIENDRDRKMTIMTTTFMPCGAKMPIVALIAGAIFGGAWWVAPSAYFIGIAAVIISGILLKKTRLFTGDPAPFVMELPSYHLPTAGSVLRSTGERGWSFIKKAGTIILLASIFIWFMKSFGIVDGHFTMVEDMDLSLLGVLGAAIAPVFAPLGFGSWQAAVATIMGLVAKEEVVSVFGVLYGVSGDALELVEEGAFEGLSAISMHFTALSAYAFLVFNLLCAPCFAAIGAIRREMNNAKWTLFAVGYQCVFAYVMALIVFQLGTFFTTGAFGVGTMVAILLLAAFIYLLVRPHRDPKAIGVAVRAH